MGGNEQKSGTLAISSHGLIKSFYLQDGRIIFISYQKEGERLGEFFLRTGRLDPKQIMLGLRGSKRLNVPFTGYLIEHGIIDRDALEQTLHGLAETAFTDALAWEGGSFAFTEAIPPLILNGRSSSTPRLSCSSQ